MEQRTAPGRIRPASPLTWRGRSVGSQVPAATPKSSRRSTNIATACKPIPGARVCDPQQRLPFQQPSIHPKTVANESPDAISVPRPKTSQRTISLRSRKPIPGTRVYSPLPNSRSNIQQPVAAEPICRAVNPVTINLVHPRIKTELACHRTGTFSKCLMSGLLRFHRCVSLPSQCSSVVEQRFRKP